MRLFLAVAFASLAGLTACLPSKQDVDTAQAIIQIGDAINDIRQTQASLQDEIDSLRLEVAKRDTVIKQLANLAGVAIPP
jgi:septal ring factor EnvC (AmiA/AmiB activator)